MTRDDARATMLRCLDEIAPGAGVDRLAPDDDVREALDLDSMDVFNLVAALAEETGVDIPDRDVAALTTLDAFVDRLVASPLAR
jgi:acyl carrier protein